MTIFQLNLLQLVPLHLFWNRTSGD